MLENMRWLAKAAVVALVRPKEDRRKSAVLDEYSANWTALSRHLESCSSVEQWLRIKGVEDGVRFCNVAGRLERQAFDWQYFNRNKIVETLQREFPGARSVTEYGSGIGRNLLFLKQRMPEVQCYGYELCRPGVELAQAAASKFGLQVEYSQLDYVGAADSEYVFPDTDVAFTMYSLEQIPTANRTAVENIMRHVTRGSIHIEPVPENYPYTIRGLVGRLDHWKADYLSHFERNISSIELAAIKKERLDTAHNPLMFPTLYVFKKTC
jgi:hypothetical protein